MLEYFTLKIYLIEDIQDSSDEVIFVYALILNLPKVDAFRFKTCV